MFVHLNTSFKRKLQSCMDTSRSSVCASVVKCIFLKISVRDTKSALKYVVLYKFLYCSHCDESFISVLSDMTNSCHMVFALSSFLQGKKHVQRFISGGWLWFSCFSVSVAMILREDKIRGMCCTLEAEGDRDSDVPYFL